MNQSIQSIKVIQNKLVFLVNEKSKTASLISSDSASGDVLIPKCVQHESQNYLITIIEKGSFKYSQRIKSIKFASDSELKTIREHAFAGSMVKNISIPSCVSELNEGWCDGLHKFTKVTVMKSKIQNIVFYDDKFIIGKSDTKSDEYNILYFAQRDIKEAIIPPFIKIISSYAFSNSSLEKVTISHHITKICKCAFSCCYKLRNFEVEDNSELTIIGDFSFAGSEIENLKIPSNIQEFHKGWCEGMQFLTSINVFQNKEANISYYDDKYIIGKSDLKSDIYDIIIFARRDVTHPIIPSFIKQIESHSFAYSSLIQIIIPIQVIQICDYSFSSCSKLKYIEISPISKLEIIGNHAFAYSSLKCFFIPPKIKKIGCEIFSYCNDLQIIEISENINPQILDKSLIFNNFNEKTILMIPSYLMLKLK